jgi:hypothetical protein
MNRRDRMTASRRIARVQRMLIVTILFAALPLVYGISATLSGNIRGIQSTLWMTFGILALVPFCVPVEWLVRPFSGALVRSKNSTLLRLKLSEEEHISSTPLSQQTLYFLQRLPELERGAWVIISQKSKRRHVSLLQSISRLGRMRIACLKVEVQIEDDQSDRELDRLRKAVPALPNAAYDQSPHVGGTTSSLEARRKKTEEPSTIERVWSARISAAIGSALWALRYRNLFTEAEFALFFEPFSEFIQLPSRPAEVE